MILRHTYIASLVSCCSQHLPFADVLLDQPERQPLLQHRGGVQSLYDAPSESCDVTPWLVPTLCMTRPWLEQGVQTADHVDTCTEWERNQHLPEKGFLSWGVLWWYFEIIHNIISAPPVTILINQWVNKSQNVTEENTLTYARIRLGVFVRSACCHSHWSPYCVFSTPVFFFRYLCMSVWKDLRYLHNNKRRRNTLILVTKYFFAERQTVNHCVTLYKNRGWFSFVVAIIPT